MKDALFRPFSTRRRAAAVAIAALLVQAAMIVVSPSDVVAGGKELRRLVHTDPAAKLPNLARPARARSAGGGDVSAAAATPACSSSHSKGFQLLYARPSDVPSRLPSLQDALLADAASAADRIVNDSASGPVRPRFFCGVTDVNTGRASSGYNASDPLWTIIDDLEAKGYNLTSRKYVIWWDGASHPYACGEGTFANDDRASQSNYNNLGPDYAIVYKQSGSFCGWVTVLHEMGHTLGAVMQSAPHATSGWHCTDESDIMCYPDGPGVVMTSSCPGGYSFFDCNKDDYFNPSPPGGSYLATHWNTYNSAFLEPAVSPTPPPPSPDPSPSPSPTQTSGGTPETSILSGPAGAVSSTGGTFSFSSTVSGSTFRCSLDGSAPAVCASPRAYSNLSQGAHTFSVFAVGPDGISDATPAVRAWSVDTAAPSVSMTAPSIVTQSSRAIPVGWSVSDASSVPSHEIRYRAASTKAPFGGYTTWKTVSSPGATFPGGGGWTYCFSVRSTDAAGNVSGWSNEKCAAVPLDDRAGWTGGFDRASGPYFDGSVSVARRSGSRLYFSNMRAKYINTKVQMCSACRYLEVYWNGRLVKRMSLYSAQAKWVTVPIAWFSTNQYGTLMFYTRAPVVVVDNVGVSQV